MSLLFENRQLVSGISFSLSLVNRLNSLLYYKSVDLGILYNALRSFKHEPGTWNLSG
jgi:hypothetical protein